MSFVPEKDPSLIDLLKVVDRRRRVFFGVAAAIFLLSVLACIFMTRRYEAKGVFEVENSSSDALDLQDMISGSGGGQGISTSTTVDMDMATQAQLLQSDTLALQVIKELRLRDNKDFKPRWNPFGFFLSLITPQGAPDPMGASLEDSPHLRSKLLKIFSDHLKVQVQAGTRLIEVDFSNRDPKVAAAVVNHLIQALIDYTFQTKFSATSEVSRWLEDQLGDLRKQSEDLQAKVVALQQGSGIFGVGGTDLQGKPVVYSPILDKLQEATTELSQAEMNRVLKQSVYEVVKSGNPELISQLSGTSLLNGTTGVTTSLTLIQNLRTQEATLRSQISQDASQFGSAYPKLVEERAALRGLDQSLEEEIQRTRSRAENDYTIAANAENGARKSYETAQKAAEALNDKTIEYTILSKEADESQTLYQDLLKRLKEAGILEGLHSSNLTMVDIARTPDRPSRPNVPVYLTLGVFVGLFIGFCAALLVNAVDNKVQGIEEIEALGMPLLGILPQFKASEIGRGPLLSDPRYSAYSEATRSLRSSMMISRSGEPPKVLLVTSGSPAEGKSTVSMNLAAAFAQYGKKVLLAEADMRRPTLTKRLGMDFKGGLSVLLADQSATFEPSFLPQHENLHIFPAGPTPPYPAELLGSARMKELMQVWRTVYDFIVIDSPPVLPVTDAQILEGLADATVLIVRIGRTSRVALKRSYNLLLPHAKNPEMPNVGIVLNSITVRSAAYYGYYGYYGGQKYDYTSGGGTDGQE